MQDPDEQQQLINKREMKNKVNNTNANIMPGNKTAQTVLNS